MVQICIRIRKLWWSLCCIVVWLAKVSKISRMNVNWRVPVHSCYSATISSPSVDWGSDRWCRGGEVTGCRTGSWSAAPCRGTRCTPRRRSPPTPTPARSWQQHRTPPGLSWSKALILYSFQHIKVDIIYKHYLLTSGILAGPEPGSLLNMAMTASCSGVLSSSAAACSWHTSCLAHPALSSLSSSLSRVPASRSSADRRCLQ